MPRCPGRFVTLHKYCPYSELFWSVFSRIWTEYGEIRSIESECRSRSIQSECREMRTRITPNTDTFYKVWMSFVNSVYVLCPGEYVILTEPCSKQNWNRQLISAPKLKTKWSRKTIFKPCLRLFSLCWIFWRMFS